MDPLHGILPVSWTRYIYIYVYGYVYGPVHLRRCRYFHHIHEHTAALQAPPSDPTPWSASLASECSLVTGFDLNWLTIFDLIRLTCFPPDSIWLTSNVFVFNLSHTIRITIQSGFREYHIGQGFFEIFQHWNHGIFHNSYNWNWVWWDQSNKKNREAKIYPHPRLSSDNPILLKKGKKHQWGNPLQNSGCYLQLVELIQLWRKKPKKKKSSMGRNPCKILAG